MIFTAATITQTREIGARIAMTAHPGDVFALNGDLGCGKTELVRGFMGYFDSSVIVRSPSFSIVNTYSAGCFEVYHFDFYRLTDASELFEIGFEEYLGNNGVCLIEWAAMFPDILPQAVKTVQLYDRGPTVREIHCVNFDV